MRVYTYSQYGGPEVLRLEDRPTPSPSANQVLIKVHATTVSSGDWRARSLVMPKGLGFVGRLVFGITKPRNPILGTELSGVIAAIGENVTNFAVGDAVIAFPGADMGAYADYITLPADGSIAAMPDDMAFDVAAAIPFGGTTAYDFLINKAKLKAGERVLINGASGSVGSACVQIAKHFGAHVTGVCSAPNADLVLGLGADDVIDYKARDFTKEGANQEGANYDMVVDTIGNVPFKKAQHALVRGGRMVLIAGKTSDMLFGSIKASLKGKKLIGGVASESVDILKKVIQLAAQGHFKPVIDRSFDFSQMVAAHTHVDMRHKKGNVVVTLAPQISQNREHENQKHHGRMAS